ncbi:MAG: hypothetical protein K9H64_06080 [Bacteroidales bacterium]|nr:hypothetical protein [Bacteroidales bacterium]MCF8455473.1 hypothetical protein [Bacteroidales bacterium]
MKTKVIFSLMFVGLFVSTQAYCQIQPQQPNEPKEDIKVNREYDENGNMIRYDSTYTWSWSSNGENESIPDSMFQFNNGFGNFSIFDMDSLFQQFNTMMPGTMFPDSMFFNDPFFQGVDPFGNFGPDIHSLFDDHFQQFFNHPFFNQPGNNQNYNQWMDQYKQQMDSIKLSQPQVVPKVQAPKASPKKVKYNQPVKTI